MVDILCSADRCFALSQLGRGRKRQVEEEEVEDEAWQRGR